MLPKSLRPLKPYLWKYRWQYLFSAFTVLANNAIWIQFPLVIGRAIDDLNRGATQHIGRYSLLLLLITCGKGVFTFLMRWKMIGISREIEFDLRNDLFTHLESLPYSYYQRNRTGDIMARATNDLNAVRNLLGPAIMYSANTIGFMAGALYVMWHISPHLMLFAFLPLPLASILVQNLGRKIHDRFERIQAMFSDISARAQENFSGARVIRAYAQEEAEIRSFETANLEYIARSLRLVRLMGMLWPSLEAMLALGIVLVLWLGGREVLLNHITTGPLNHVVASSPCMLNSSVHAASSAASTTGRYSGRHPAITALIATFSTIAGTRLGGTTATTSPGAREVPSSIRSTRAGVGATTGSPSVKPRSNSASASSSS